MTALEVSGLNKSFGAVAVLRGVDLAVYPGDIAVVLGPSGEGKTTLLRLIAGFDRPDRGTISIGGVEVTGPTRFVAPERRHVGIVPQEGALFPHLTVAGNVAFGLPRGPDRNDWVDQALEMVGLSGLQHRRPRELSGGQQHRVALARALAPRPALVLLDEPFSSLDTGLRAQIRNDVLGALRAAGATAVIVTHDQVEALAVADQLAVMLHGRIAQSGAPDELYRRPVSAAIARFLGDANVLDAEVRGGWATCALGRLAVAAPVGDVVASAGVGRVVVRPEQVELVESGGVSGAVVGREYYGHDAMVHLAIGDTQVLARVGAQNVPAVGAAVSVTVRGDVWPIPDDD